MSVDEDIELKNLVAQTLENKGILPKIRAELRANVFLALEENPNTQETLLKNDKLSAFLKVPVGTLVLNLIHEFLEFFELEFTLSVFEPETKFGKEYNSITRDKMINELKIADTNKKNPLLFHVIDRVVNINKQEIAKIGNTQKEVKPIAQNGSSTLASPNVLNTTYVKAAEDDSSFLNENKNDNKDDTNESIKEEVLSNNCSEADSSSEVQLSLGQISKMHDDPLSPLCGSKLNEFETCSTKVTPKETLEIDLLTFTPVKDNTEKDKTKLTLVPDNAEEKTEQKNELKTLSVLGDLPPLNAPIEEKDFDMKDLKAMMDGWSEEKNSKNIEEGEDINGPKPSEDKCSVKLKSGTSDKSQKSEITEADDFEDDSSDLLSSQGTTKTVDETISRSSWAADYLESL